LVDDARLDFLVKEFVNVYGKMTDISLDVFLEPPLWFMPIENNQAKKEGAKYFLLAASLCDSEVTGNSRNVRILLDDFHDAFGQALYNTKDPKMLEVETKKCQNTFQFFDQMGPRKNEIPQIISDANRFIQDKAQGDLIEYTKRMVMAGKRPVDMFEDLCSSIRSDVPHRGKFWIYLRWMVRKHPDLGLFDFKPQDLTVPLTTPTLRLAASRELTDNNLSQSLKSKEETVKLWNNPQTTETIQKKLNEYSRSMFPNDPAKVDFPFFILGRWLTGFNLDKETLEKTLQFFLDRYHKIGTWPIRYLVERRHFTKFSCDYNIGAQSQLELPVADFLLKNSIKFEFEPIQFWWVKEHGIVAITPPYTPDFLLSLKYKGKKVLLEPHGVWDDLRDYLGKLHVFRMNYGEFFYLILIVPRNFVTYIQKTDPKQESCDQLWTIDEFPSRMQQFQASCSTY
jgi:hypothetical protein